MRFAASLSDPLDHHMFDVGNRLGRIEAFRANLRTIHNRVATIELERVFKIIKPLAGAFVAAVDQPAIGLQECGWPKIFVAIPPIRRAAC